MKVVPFLFVFLLLCAFSCNSGSEIGNNSEKASSSASSIPDRAEDWLQLQQNYARQRNEGFDFYAKGNEGDWTLGIDEDKGIRFSSKGEASSFEVPGAVGRQPADINTTLFSFDIPDGTCSVRIWPDSCKSSTGESLPYSVKVFIKPADGKMQRMEGCGLYLNNPRLNDIWALKYSSSYSSQKTDLSLHGNPYIEINLQTNRVYGNLGCGDLTGYLTPKGNKLHIYGLDYTDKSKPCESAIAKQLLQDLSYKDLKISLVQTELILSGRRDTLVFQKVD